MRRTFADDIVVYISVCFAGRNNPNRRRGFHLVGGLARRHRGRMPSDVPQDEANTPRDTCQVITGLTWKTL
jgi:hypothetical protein